MLNPLSLQPGQVIMGRAINEWCIDQINGNGSHKREAERLLEHFTFIDDRKYILARGPFGPGQDPCRNDCPRIIFRKIKTYE